MLATGRLLACHSSIIGVQVAASVVGIRNSELKNCTHNRADEKRTDVSQSEHEASGPGHEGKYRQTCQE